MAVTAAAGHRFLRLPPKCLPPVISAHKRALARISPEDEPRCLTPPPPPPAPPGAPAAPAATDC